MSECHVQEMKVDFLCKRYSARNCDITRSIETKQNFMSQAMTYTFPGNGCKYILQSSHRCVGDE